jgi:hypothetical protein
MKGIIQGNDQQDLHIVFQPRAVNLYEIMVRVHVYSLTGESLHGSDMILDARQPGKVHRPALLQDLSFKIVASGEQGAMLFHPKDIEADVRLVNTSEMKDIFLENISSSDIQYELYYTTEFIADAKDEDDGSDNLSILRPLVVDQSHGNATKRDTSHSIFCSHPIGRLNARSKNRIQLTFFPIASGSYRFTIHAKILMSDSALLNDDAVEKRLKGTSILEVIDPEYSVVAHFTARASFPTLLFADVRSSDITYPKPMVYKPQDLWRQFSFKDLNRELAKPLTKHENILFNASSGDKSLYKRYSFNFTPAPKQIDCIQSYDLMIVNDGFLESSFHIHYPNEKDLDLELWCDEPIGSDQSSILEDMKLFTVFPMSGKLKPKESIMITMTYSLSTLHPSNSITTHRLPLLVKIDQGKHFFLDLIGQTLPVPIARSASMTIASKRSNPYSTNQRRSSFGTINSSMTKMSLQDMPENLSSSTAHLPALPEPQQVLLWVPVEQPQRRYELPSAPIGVHPNYPILQQVELFNVSAFAMKYEVINTPSMDSCYFYIMNPSGTIDAQSSIALKIYFIPYQAQAYSLPIQVKFSSVVDQSTFSSPDRPDTQTPPLSDDHSEVSSRFQPVRLRETSKRSFRKSLLHSSQSKRNVHLNPINKPVVIEEYFLDFNLEVNSFDPRDTDSWDLHRLIGDSPPERSYFHTAHDQVYISTNMICFSNVPSSSSSHAMLMIQNINSADHCLEYSFDIDDSYLLRESCLSIEPASGILSPQEKIAIHITVHGNCNPTVFYESLVLRSREVHPLSNNSRKVCAVLTSANA